jgi:site-specific recombinase XerD
MDHADLASLLESYLRHLRGERKSDQTVRTYGNGVRTFLAWCQREGIDPALDRPTVDKFVAALLDGGAEAATARSRQLALRRFSAWLAEEDEIPADELARLKPPKLDVKAVHPLDDDQLRAMLAACKGPEFRDKRDEAIIRLMTETGARAGEVIDLEVGDVDLNAGTALIRRGKGGKARRVPFGPHRLSDRPLPPRPPKTPPGLHAGAVARAGRQGVRLLRAAGHPAPGCRSVWYSPRHEAGGA